MALPSTSVLGKPIPRIEGFGKLSGHATYTADVALPGMLWARLVRSPHAHARIVSIDTSRALKVPGVRAVLTGADLPRIRVGRSDTLEVGDVVLAIGNSLGLSQSVTMGIISATGRGELGVGLASFVDFIQTDAAINAGNSGGALINTRGELVGINVATINRADSPTAPEGLGFAIPVNLVRGVMEQLIAHGRVIRGYLGVDEPEDLPASQTRVLGIDGPAVLITGTSGPAAAAGLRPGDVLTHINGERVFTRREAMTVVASAQPGEHISIRVVRPDGTPFQTEAVLEERQPPTGR